ncbi:MAG: ABC transporter permease [Gemmatimonadetes bacterium]|nr:ABC transporter permease [Gemmatimonadota bacterium]
MSLDTSPPAPRGDAEPAVRASARGLVARLSPVLGLVAVVLIFAVLADEPGRFLSAFNLRVVLSQTVITALGAIGMTMIVVGGGIDLSVGAAIALTGVLAALGLRDGWSPSLAVAAAVAAGGFIGLVNGAVITALRVVPFIVTLGMLGTARGTAKWLANEQTVNVPPSWVNDLVVTMPKPAWLILPIGVWVVIVLAILAAPDVALHRVWAAHLRLGSNEAAARACGIDTTRLKLAMYSVAGCLFGLTRVMQVSRLRQGDPTVANGVELDIIAAVVIGGGSLNGGEGASPARSSAR